jgi:diguanylate cyclase (GGDEF)-like protein
VPEAHEHTHTTHEPLNTEYRLKARDGHYVWIRDAGVIVTGDDGAPLYLQGYLLDISPEREAEEQLRRQALYDPLTGLANRTHFNDRLGRAIAAVRSPNEKTAILFADVDGFKGVNDRFGHHIGDAVLCALGDRLHGVIRAADTAARLGRRFAVIVERVVDPADVDRRAAIHESSRSRRDRRAGCRSRRRSASRSALELLKEADAAMYRANRSPASASPSTTRADKAAVISFRHRQRRGARARPIAAPLSADRVARDR